jgi:hypothetical protein
MQPTSFLPTIIFSSFVPVILALLHGLALSFFLLLYRLFTPLPLGIKFQRSSQGDKVEISPDQMREPRIILAGAKQAPSDTKHPVRKILS